MRLTAEEAKRALEDELRDPKNVLEYFFPRPIRVGGCVLTSASCLIAAILGAVNLVQDMGKDPMLQASAAAHSAATTDLAVNLVGCAVFAAIAVVDNRAGAQRIVERKTLRAKQIQLGDREVYVNKEGERMSKLKEVDDTWILRRLERWGRKDAMPFLGPKKGAILAGIVAEKRPKLAVEVGTMAGYTAILIGQQLALNARLVTYEKDLFWFIAAKRFLWQASQGSRVKDVPQARLDRRVDVQLGDAVEALQQWGARMPADGSGAGAQRVDLLFLDGIPKDTLAYLKAAEPILAPGCIVVADNAGVFAEGGMKAYLEYVRSSPRYSSSYIESTLEWRDDVVDGIEVSTFLG